MLSRLNQINFFYLQGCEAAPRFLFHLKTNAIVNPASGTKLVRATISSIQCILELTHDFDTRQKGRVGQWSPAEQLYT